MSKQHMSPLEIKILQALRAGEMTVETLLERYSTNYSAPIRRLKNKSFIEKVGEETYRITEVGKQQCPRRVDLI